MGKSRQCELEVASHVVSQLRTEDSELRHASAQCITSMPIQSRIPYPGTSATHSGQGFLVTNTTTQVCMDLPNLGSPTLRTPSKWLWAVAS